MHDITVLDGGMGRELARMGAPFRQPEWSALALMEAPHYVGLAHDAFVAAGADVITANSYAVVPFHIGEERFRRDGVALAALAGQLARQAADRAGRPVRVAGSLPPTGGSYRPDLFDAVRRALGENPKPLWVSFTLRDDVEAGATPVLRSGQTLGEAIDAAVSARATALLFNCSQPEAMGAAIETVQRTLARTGTPLVIGAYANAFPPQRADARANEELHGLRGDIDPPGYARWAEQWLALGARIVGGCCGIGPGHIAALRDAVDARGARHTGLGE
ncbi:homocysteine methyltransferase [Burkholderia cepacia]|uniref:homocysteine S-methyltransferase family protein n=1 Tax=Burkholderia cepacia TaxID=292 RepID=UPI00075FE781|nr:homocysteine S-methyltransferase family protein [Burkholderia cepacia]KWE28971.1 homocysteine methyltransferase [Burkholderia cepacia]